jgi:hypothetical protein
MAMATEGQTTSRPGRCANHPAVASVGACDVCRRELCLACAVPVRGQVIGPECLSQVLTDAPPAPNIPVPARPGGGRLALAGFALVLVASIFPWSRFGDSSRYFGAWAPHSSFVAVMAAALGLTLIAFDRYRPVDPRLEIAGVFVLGALSAVTAYLHHRHPPLLSEPTMWPLIAAAGAILAMAGAMLTGVAWLRSTRSSSSTSPS